MSPSDQRRMLSSGRKAFISVEPLLYHTHPDVMATRTKVAAWCHQNLKSLTFEVSATRTNEWTIERATLEVLCMLPEDAAKVRSFFNNDDLPF